MEISNFLGVFLPSFFGFSFLFSFFVYTEKPVWKCQIIYVGSEGVFGH